MYKVFVCLIMHTIRFDYELVTSKLEFIHLEAKLDTYMYIVHELKISIEY